RSECVAFPAAERCAVADVVAFVERTGREHGQNRLRTDVGQIAPVTGRQIQRAPALERDGSGVAPRLDPLDQATLHADEALGLFLVGVASARRPGRHTGDEIDAPEALEAGT